MKKLAIIIPAYKEAFFAKALDSLDRQTNKDFSVYIGNDCSPFALDEIVQNYTESLDIHYHRFDNNIGSKNLVEQWTRCVELSQGEEWIWLFSDDDLVDAFAVENFYALLDENGDKFDVYRFDTCVIDNNDTILYYTPVGPREESSEEMAYNLLLGKRGNSMPDHIFSRKIYQEKGGFVFTHFAQAADWATSILFSQEKGIAIIPGSYLFWRFSGVNISSIASRNTQQMVYGHLQFIEWLAKHFTYLEESSSPITRKMILNAARVNLRDVIMRHYKKLNNADLYKVFHLITDILQVSVVGAVHDLYAIKRGTDSRINAPVIFLKKVLNK